MLLCQVPNARVDQHFKEKYQSEVYKKMQSECHVLSPVDELHLFSSSYHQINDFGYV